LVVDVEEHREEVGDHGNHHQYNHYHNHPYYSFGFTSNSTSRKLAPLLLQVEVSTMPAAINGNCCYASGGVDPTY